MSTPNSPLFQVPLLVGREDELAVLRQHLDAALAGRGSLVLISGEAGIGKTALAEAVCREAAEQGPLVLIGRCYDLSETPPYGPWVEALGRFQPHDGQPPLPGAFAHRGTVGAVTSQAALLQHVADFFCTLGATRPILLVLDDLHWADPASLDLLRFAARTLADAPILIVMTYRTDELMRSHPLYALLPTLVREASAVRLALRPLRRNDIATLIADRYRLAESSEARLVTYLYNRSEGNPFYLGEILRTLEEGMTLRFDAGGWFLDDLTRVRVPPLLHQVIDGRLARLDATAQHALALAAVIGQEVPLALWATVSGTDEETMLPIIERAIEAHLLMEIPDSNQLRFVHALIREALYESILATRRRTQHRLIGEILVTAPDADPDEVAYHFRQAGDARAVEWLIAAGDRAERSVAWRTAADRYEAAVTLIPATKTNAAQRGWLYLHVGWMRRFADVSAGIVASEEASRLAMDAGDPALTASAMVQLGIFLCRIPKLERGLTLVQQGIAAFDALPAHELARLPFLRGGSISRVQYGNWGSLVMYLAHAGRFRDVRAICEGEITTEPVSADFDAREVTKQQTSQRGLAVTYAALGMPNEANAAFARSRSHPQIAGNPMGVAHNIIHELAWLVLPYRADRVMDRQALVNQLDEALIRASGILLESQDHRLAHVMLWVLEGRWAEARETAIHGYATATNISNRLLAMYALSTLARHQGERDRGWALVHDAFPAGPGTPPGDMYFLDNALVQRCAAYLAVDDGDLATARAWLEAHDRWLAWNSAVLGVADGQLGWGAYYRAAGELDRAYQHATHALSSASEPRQPLTLLAAHRLLGELDTDAERFKDADTRLDTALALADACAAPYERALTLLARAELRAAERRRDEAVVLLDEVRAICLPLGAKPALARADALMGRLTPRIAPRYPAGLSEREIEVLRLLAAGHTNRQIADMLALSERTIHVHVRNIFTKTHTDNRAGATAFAFRNNLA